MEQHEEKRKTVQRVMYLVVVLFFLILLLWIAKDIILMTYYDLDLRIVGVKCAVICALQALLLVITEKVKKKL